MTSPQCFLCSSPGVFKCDSNCGTWSCSSAHLELHSYNDYCYPIKMVQKSGFGQSLVTTRDVKPLELILRDHHRPISAKIGFCISCHKKIEKEYPCSRCQVPYFCTPSCNIHLLHSQNECKILSDKNLVYEDKNKFYESLMPLRVILLRDFDPNSWSRLERLEDHFDKRQNEKETLNYFEENVESYIRNDLKLKHLFSKQEIDRALGLIRINGIQTVEYRAIYPTMALINNSCISNSRCIHDDDNNMIIRAQIYLKAGTEIKIGYNSLFTGIIERQYHFKKTWFFNCDCTRCNDPTECGSDLNAMVCPKADGGLLRPFDWKCNVCSETSYSTSDIWDFETELLKKLKRTESKLNKCSELIEFYESLLASKNSQLFAPSHYLMMKIKSNLISLFGNGPKYYYSQMSNDLIEKKIEYCRDFINVMEKVDPGETDWKTATNFEKLQAEAFLVEKKLVDLKETDKVHVQNKFKRILTGLNDVVEKLLIEESGEHLKEMKRKAIESSKTIKEILLYIEIL